MGRVCVGSQRKAEPGKVREVGLEFESGGSQHNPSSRKALVVG